MTEDFKKELVEAIKEVAAAITESGGAEIKFLVKETTAGELIGHVIVEEKQNLLCKRLIILSGRAGNE